MIPRSGGQYVFARRGLGPYAGFIVGWNDWLSTCGSAAVAAFVIGEYSGGLLPPLAGRVVPVAVAVTVSLALLQWRGLRWGSRAQEVTGLLKGLGFLALAAACFVPRAESVAAPPDAPLAGWGVPIATRLVLALQAVVFTYDGWSGPIYFSEEVRNPGRDIPRSLFGGVLSVMGIYLLLNLALVRVLPMGRLAGDPFALGSAAAIAFGASGETLLRGLMVVSMLSAINAYHLMATRVLFAMGRDGMVSLRASQVNRGGTPSTALLASAVAAVLLIVLGGAFRRLIAVTSFFFVANYTLSFVTLFVLRRREPDTPRPYRAWGHPWTTGSALAGSVAFLLGAVASDVLGGTMDSILALLALAMSYPAYRAARVIVERRSR